MKYLCPGCDRLVELGGFRLDAGALVLRCPRCGEESRAEPAEAARPPVAEPAAPARVPLFSSAPNVVQLRPGASEAVRLAAEAARSEEPFRVPEGYCPKCVARRSPGAASCPACGLTFELFDPTRLKPGPALAARWLSLLAKWDDLALHDEVLQEALVRGDLPVAGRLYRLRLACAPEDPVALRGLDEVVRLVTAHATTMPEQAEAVAGPHWKLAAAIAFIGMFAAAVMLVVRTLASRGP